MVPLRDSSQRASRTASWAVSRGLGCEASSGSRLSSSAEVSPLGSHEPEAPLAAALFDRRQGREKCVRDSSRVFRTPAFRFREGRDLAASAPATPATSSWPTSDASVPSLIPSPSASARSNAALGSARFDTPPRGRLRRPGGFPSAAPRRRSSRSAHPRLDAAVGAIWRRPLLPCREPPALRAILQPCGGIAHFASTAR